jgi:hypothetical protein
VGRAAETRPKVDAFHPGHAAHVAAVTAAEDLAAKRADIGRR